MDNTTKYLLIQEAKIENVISSLKVILPNITSAVASGNIEKMKSISKRLPQTRELRFIERDAINQIPGFKKSYESAKKEVAQSKVFDAYTGRVASMVVALVSSTTKISEKEIVNKAVSQLHKTSFIPIPVGIIMPMIKLVLFISFVTAIFTGNSALVVGAFDIAGKSITAIFNTLAAIINYIIKASKNPEGIGDTIYNDVKDNVTDKITDILPSGEELGRSFTDFLLKRKRDFKDEEEMLIKLNPLKL